MSMNLSLSERQKRAAVVACLLDEYYPNPPNGFLEHRDAYTLLVAVLLSAQCTDVRVNTVTPSLFALADNPVSMAACTPEQVAAIIRPCGLSPKKSRAIVALSQQLVTLHRGVVPCSWEALEALPGVGHKTASVVMVQAFDIPAFPVDTHIRRLAGRWGLSEYFSVEKIEGDLKQLYPEKSWGLRHLQMILFGRNHCTTRGCHGAECPICATLQNIFPPLK